MLRGLDDHLALFIETSAKYHEVAIIDLVKTYKILAFWMAVVVSVTFVLAADTNKIAGEIIEFGNYKVIESKSDVAVSSETGQARPSLHVAKVVEFVNRTNHIIARKGTSFGFRYRLTNLPTNELVRLNVETIHPEFTLPDGKKDSGRVLQIHCSTTNGVWNHHVGYRFDDDFEMVEGEWKFTIYSAAGSPILAKSFSVKKN